MCKINCEHACKIRRNAIYTGIRILHVEIIIIYINSDWHQTGHDNRQHVCAYTRVCCARVRVCACVRRYLLRACVHACMCVCVCFQNTYLHRCARTHSIRAAWPTTTASFSRGVTLASSGGYRSSRRVSLVSRRRRGLSVSAGRHVESSATCRQRRVAV